MRVRKPMRARQEILAERFGMFATGQWMLANCFEITSLRQMGNDPSEKRNG